jgi:Zn-dependent protease
MFTDPGRSQWDLQFHLLGVPIRVHPMFWLMSLLLGNSWLRVGISYLLAWVVCVFVSILIHEMGHVLAARAFGVWSEIVLYGFGGLAIGAGQMRSKGQHIIVCFAGPLAGFVFLGTVILVLPIVSQEEWSYVRNQIMALLGLEAEDRDLLVGFGLKRAILSDLFWINLVWGLVNLLPIWPLDGGQISKDVFAILSPRNGASIALGISMVLSGLMALNSLVVMNGGKLLPSWVPAGGLWTVLMFGYLAVGSFMALQEEQRRGRWTDEHWTRWDNER